MMVRVLSHEGETFVLFKACAEDLLFATPHTMHDKSRQGKYHSRLVFKHFTITGRQNMVDFMTNFEPSVPWNEEWRAFVTCLQHDWTDFVKRFMLAEPRWMLGKVKNVHEPFPEITKIYVCKNHFPNREKFGVLPAVEMCPFPVRRRGGEVKLVDSLVKRETKHEVSVFTTEISRWITFRRDFCKPQNADLYDDFIALRIPEAGLPYDSDYPPCFTPLLDPLYEDSDTHEIIELLSSTFHTNNYFNSLSNSQKEIIAAQRGDYDNYFNSHKGYLR